MTEIVWLKRRIQFCRLAELGNNLTDTAFSQKSALTEKEMPIWPPAPGSFSMGRHPLAPAFRKVFTMFEIGIEQFVGFLDERDLAMFESLATANDGKW
jgi:hypothetical protein